MNSEKYHSDRKSLVTDIDTKNRHGSLSARSQASTVALPSPSLVAARAYYLEHVAAVGQSINAIQLQAEGQLFPRRHSVMPISEDSSIHVGLQLQRFNFSSTRSNLKALPEPEEGDFKVEFGENSYRSDDSPISGTRQNDLAKVARVATRRQPDVTRGLEGISICQIPFQYTHDRLRNWGYAYLGNKATADAFVNAVSLRRPSLTLVKVGDSQNSSEPSKMVTIRARVLPKTNTRKPFLIQRQLDIEELRRSIPAVQGQLGKASGDCFVPLRRSSRARRSSTQEVSSKSTQRTNIERHLGRALTTLGPGAEPIHIEFAIHYLPVLAALMLSGHVRKGDSIDLPLPRPEAWRDVLSYIYTGKGVLTASVKEDIMFLGGNVE